MRNRGVIRGVDASIAANSQRTRLPLTSRSVLRASLGLGAQHAHDPEILPPSPPPPPPSLLLCSSTSLPRTCVHASAPGECERTYGRSGRSMLADVFKNVGSGPRGSASLHRTGSRYVSTFAPRPTPINLLLVKVARVKFAKIRWPFQIERFIESFFCPTPFTAYRHCINENRDSLRFLQTHRSRIYSKLCHFARFEETMTS